MNYKIKLADGTQQLIEISSAYFKSWHVWYIKFNDGKVAMLFKLSGEWMQRNEDFLDEGVLKSIGHTIDKIIFRRERLAY